MKALIYRNDNNKVSVVYPANGIIDDHREEESFAALADKVVPANAPWKVINISDIPTDRTFRDAWEWED